jgi:hypothetical protein
MTPNEQKARKYNSIWQVLNALNPLEDKYHVLEALVDGITEEARTDERRRIGEIVKGMKEDTTYCGSWCDCSAHGYNKALSDIIFLINKE